jgi:hypothetical protein
MSFVSFFKDVGNAIVDHTPIGAVVDIFTGGGGDAGGAAAPEVDPAAIEEFMKYQMASTMMHQAFSILGNSDDN